MIRCFHRVFLFYTDWYIEFWTKIDFLKRFELICSRQRSIFDKDDCFSLVFSHFFPFFSHFDFYLFQIQVIKRFIEGFLKSWRIWNETEIFIILRPAKGKTIILKKRSLCSWSLKKNVHNHSCLISLNFSRVYTFFCGKTDALNDLIIHKSNNNRL